LVARVEVADRAPLRARGAGLVEVSARGGSNFPASKSRRSPSVNPVPDTTFRTLVRFSQSSSGAGAEPHTTIFEARLSSVS
jgi:hypothetical protein